MTIHRIERVLKQLEIDASPAHVAKLLRYAQLVLEWNSRVNITGAPSLEVFVDGPLFDALTILSVMVSHTRFVDIGSGGGLPAIPMAVMRPDTHFTMVEPRGKRASFLQMVVNELQLNAMVQNTQDRELTVRDFDGASAQAVFPPKKWIQRAKQLVGDEGMIYVLSSEEVVPAICPNHIRILAQKRFEREGAVRYACRLQRRG